MAVVEAPPGTKHSYSSWTDEQQNLRSPNYHKWLTTKQMEDQFGPSPEDIQRLEAAGFTVNGTLIDFSGTVGQILQGFHTEIHYIEVNGAGGFCSDPGLTPGNGAEATLDTQWASAAAPNATIVLGGLLGRAGAFTDTLANMTASGGAITGTCAGTTPATLTAGATSLSFSGITIPASSSCTVIFNVTSSTVGAQPNTTSGVSTTRISTVGAAGNTATLTVLGPATIAKTFNPTSIPTGTASTVTLTLTNNNLTTDLTGGSFTDTPTNMSASGGAVTGTCGHAYRLQHRLRPENPGGRLQRRWHGECVRPGAGE